MSTKFDYEEFPPYTQDLKYQGDAFVPEKQTFLRLTKTDNWDNPQKKSIGRVVYSPKVQFWERGKQANFHTTFKFFITDDNNTRPGDGIAFFISRVDYPMGSAGGGLGIYPDSDNGPNFFAVEFDIHKNPWDPNSCHVGININSHKSLAYMDFENSVKKDVTVDVTYDAPTKKITVKATSDSKTSSVEHVVNLKDVLPHAVQVGISSATGNDVAIHDLYSWSFTSNLVSDN